VAKENLIKQDLNFLEYPIWLIDDRVEQGVFTWKDREGFTFETHFRPPTKSDIIFLLFLLSKSQKGKWARKVSFTKYEMLKACNISVNKQWYDRINESLKRWEFTRLMFEGSFYDGKKYSTLHFGIIDSWGIVEGSQQVWVSFNSIWLSKIQSSTFYKMLDFNIMRDLRSPLAVRLYEILIKNFQGRSVWKCDALKLGLKIPLKEEYASQIVKKVIPALNRVNTFVDFHINLTVTHQARGKALLIFEKTDKPIPKQETFPFPNEKLEDVGFTALLEFLPPSRREQKTLWVLIKTYYSRFGLDYVTRNIRYTNKNSTKNYRKFLADSLQNDWGLSMVEDETTKEVEETAAQKRAEEAACKAKDQMEKRAIEFENQEKAKVYIENLPPEALKHLKEEAVARMDAPTAELLRKKSPGANFMVKMLMNKIIQERMKSS